MFSGDVLNTTARIQGLCNSLATDLLVSGPLVERLNLGEAYPVKSMGQRELRGRGEKVEVFSLLAPGA